MRVFISYAREDIDAAIRIYNFIRNIDGFEPWMDKFNLLPGMEWEAEVMRAIETSHIVLLLISKHSVSKTGYVQKEIKESIDKAKLYPPGKIVLIPIRLDDSEPSYRELKKLHWVDFTLNWNAGKRNLMATLKKLFIENVDTILAQLLIYLPRRQDERRLHSREEFLEVAKSSTDFSGYNLMYLDLSHLNLSGFSFVGANLVGTKFSSSKLNSVNFQWANLERANLNYTDLRESRITFVNLWGAAMKRARNIRFAIIKNNNIFDLKGLSNSQMIRFNQAGGFEASNYDVFFSYLTKSLKFSPEDIVRDYKWLGHRYFRMIFSDKARFALGYLSNLYQELALSSNEISEKGIFLIDEAESFSTIEFLDMPFGGHELGHNFFTPLSHERKKTKK